MIYPTERKAVTGGCWQKYSLRRCQDNTPKDDLTESWHWSNTPKDDLTEVKAFRTILPRMIGQRSRCSWDLCLIIQGSVVLNAETSVKSSMGVLDQCHDCQIIWGSVVLTPPKSIFAVLCKPAGEHNTVSILCIYHRYIPLSTIDKNSYYF